MDPSQPPFNFPPGGFVLSPTQLQAAQAAHAAQTAYAAYLIETMHSGYPPPTQQSMSTMPSYPAYFQPCIPTSSVNHQPENVDVQFEPAPAVSARVPKKVANRNKPNWSQNEDIALCQAWVRCSENPIVGTCQTGDNLWSNIFKDFCDQLPETVRTNRSLDSRWTIIQGDVNKWKGVVDKVRRLKSSGTNPADEWGACYVVFKDDYKKDFKLFHFWEILQHSVKWHDVNSGKSQGCPNSKKDLNAPQPPVAPTHDFTSTGLDNIDVDDLHDSECQPFPNIHVGNDPPSPFTPTGPIPSSGRSEPLKRPLGRDLAKKKRRPCVDRASEETSVRNNRLSEQVSEWRISQQNQYQMMKESNDKQFEATKAANEFHAFHLVKKIKLEQLQASISIVQAIGEAEDKLIGRASHLMTDEIFVGQAARLKELQDLNRKHNEIQLLEYSPGGSASTQMDHEGSNIDPCNITDRFSASLNTSDQE